MALIFTEQFLQQAVKLVTTDEPLGAGNLELVVCMPADLQWLTTSMTELKSMLPAVIVIPSEVMNVEFEDVGATTFSHIYNFRALVVGEYVNLADKLARTHHLANVFQSAVDRFTAPDTNCQVLYSQVDEIEYDSEEGQTLATIHDDVWASAIAFSIHTLTYKV